MWSWNFLRGHKDQIKRRQGTNIFRQSTTASYYLILSRERARWWRRGRERGGGREREGGKWDWMQPVSLLLPWCGRAGTYQVSNLFSLYWEIFIKGVITQCCTCQGAFSFSALEPSLVYFNIFDLKTQLEDNILNFVLFLRSHDHLSFSGQRLSICETARDSGAHPCPASSSGLLSPLRLLSPHAPNLCFPQTEPLHMPNPTF